MSTLSPRIIQILTSHKPPTPSDWDPAGSTSSALNVNGFVYRNNANIYYLWRPKWIFGSRITVLNMNKAKMELYESPAISAVELETDGVVCGSVRALTGAWDNQNVDPWDGSGGGSNAAGGWTDNGDSAW